MSKTKLPKSFGFTLAVVLVISNIIGSGVFKKVAPMGAELLSPTLVLLAWLFAGIITLFGVLTIGEIGSMFPQSGGPYFWLEKMYGKSIAFFYGWSCFTIIQSAAIASIAFVFAGALTTFVVIPDLPLTFTSIEVGFIYPFRNFGAKSIAASLIIFLTIINIRGAKLGGRVSEILTATILVCIVVIIASGLLSTSGSFRNIVSNSQFYPPTDFSAFGGLGILAAMVIAMRNAFWGYEGWVSLGYIGEEIKDPEKNFSRALILGFLIVITLYLLLNFSYLFVMPLDKLLTEVNRNENNIAAVIVMNQIFGEYGGQLISGIILLSTFGCTNATILTSSRIYYAMAREGLFFHQAEKIHGLYKTPYMSLIFQCLWACILVFSGSFDILTDLLIFAAFIFYGMVVFGVIILRYKFASEPRPYRTIGYPVVPAVFVLFCIILIIISIMEMPMQSLIGFALILSGLPFYLVWRPQKKP